ncbi:hypothetical protein Dda_8929 [Drechslerella dactyloides]|uniref:Uncharacterized protein n=1 Tax=Drechslerella dactyloides TaxID=74499 RepID=A0AAD6IQ55_DREDA|nr:hypothetical protein Dda_8929 [Drechslerella dactyloides]
MSAEGWATSRSPAPKAHVTSPTERSVIIRVVMYQILWPPTKRHPEPKGIAKIRQPRWRMSPAAIRLDYLPVQMSHGLRQQVFGLKRSLPSLPSHAAN